MMHRNYITLSILAILLSFTLLSVSVPSCDANYAIWEFNVSSMEGDYIQFSFDTPFTSTTITTNTNSIGNTDAIGNTIVVIWIVTIIVIITLSAILIRRKLA